MLSNKQHGFVKNRSTVSNLLEFKNYLCKSFAVTGQVDAIYTDFSKAFDKINHKRLCSKLAEYGFHGSLFRWICSYLNKRNQLVALKGYLSSPVEVTSGVPQGSHLGPLLFVIFINDLIERLSCQCLLYADDLKIFNTTSTLNDCQKLQKDLDVVSEWCVANYMHLNISKCFIISYSNKRNKITNDYTINGQVLTRSYITKDLGILFDDKLTFRQHYEHITNKANQLLGFVLRSTKGFKKPNSLLYLYYSLVRSVLEYGSSIWSPHYMVHSDSIERVQKKCLRILCYRQHVGRTNLNYERRLEKYNVQPLNTRRQYLDLVYLYKIVNSIIDSPDLLSNISFNIKFSSRRAKVTKLFALQVYKNNTSYFNPIVRMARQFNDLLKSNFELDIFDRKLSTYVKTIKGILHL